MRARASAAGACSSLSRTHAHAPLLPRVLRRATDRSRVLRLPDVPELPVRPAADIQQLRRRREQRTVPHPLRPHHPAVVPVGRRRPLHCLPVRLYRDVRVPEAQPDAVLHHPGEPLRGLFVRIYAWRTILGIEGLVNGTLLTFGWIHEPIREILNSPFAVVVALVNFLVPLAVLPIYSSMQNVSPGLLEAARDLGSSRVDVTRRVMLPLVLPEFGSRSPSASSRRPATSRSRHCSAGSAARSSPTRSSSRSARPPTGRSRQRWP